MKDRTYKGISAIALAVALMLFSLSAFAQKNSAVDTAFKRNHYSIEAAATFYSRPDIVHLYGEIVLQTRPAVSTQLGFMYGRYWQNGLGFRLGLRWSIIPFVYKWNVGYEKVDTSLKEWKSFGSWESFYEINHWQFPLQLSYQRMLKKNFMAKISAGVSIDLQLDGQIFSSYRVTDDRTPIVTQTNIMELQLDVNAERSVFASMPVEIMFSKVWRNSHCLDFGIMYSVAFKPIARGVYGFLPDNPNESFGTVAVKNTFIALKVGYTFIRGKRKELPPQIFG